MWEHLYIPGINPSWFWCTVLLIWSWILFASILLRILHRSSSGVLVCSFFLVQCLVRLWRRGYAGLAERGSFPPFGFMWKSEKDLWSFSLSVESWAFLCWEMFDCWSGLCARSRSIQMVCFFVSWSWRVLEARFLRLALRAGASHSPAPPRGPSACTWVLTWTGTLRRFV